MSSTHKKRKKCDDNPPCRIENNLGESTPLGTNDSCDDAGPSEEFWESCLEPKHKIFLSHSGAQKNFTEQLCVDLERVHHFPFFDKRDDSLPKGKRFPPLIIEAAKQCRIAVLVLSDEFFTRSKWPMTELKEFVTAQGSNNPELKILPLFLGITMKQFHEEEQRAGWFKAWDEFACEDGRVNVEAWKVALSKILGGINAMEYRGAGEGEVTFRKKVVKAICKLLPPDVKYDVAHVQSLDRLCGPIKKKLGEVGGCARFKVGVVGLYGMGGIGKTTITRAICNEMFGEFSGKVCHIEMKDNNEIELQRRVLEELTGASATILKISSSELLDLLRMRMHRQKVFLVLDNVWDNHIEEVENYLYMDYHDGSKVLVTARTLGVLKRLGIGECECMEMPNLEEDGAIGVFLHSARISKEFIKERRDLEIVQQCLEECRFSCGGEPTYHPLALKSLGSQLGSLSVDVRKWDESLKKLKEDKFNMSKDEVNRMFSILRVGYDVLRKEQQHIFLDLALLWPSKWNKDDNSKLSMEWEWLATLYNPMSQGEVIANVEALQRKGLLEKVKNSCGFECTIHDLYLEFAEAEARVQPFEERRVLLDKHGNDVPRNLRMYPTNGVSWPSLKRLIIYKSEVRSLKRANLHHCKNVEVLILNQCELLEEVDVRGMNNLRFLVVEGCRNLGSWIGLETLENLVIFCWGAGSSKSKPVVDLVFSSTMLQVVKLRDFKVQKFAHMNIGHGFRDYDSNRQWPISINGSWVPVLESSSPANAMPTFANLQELNLARCEGIGNLIGFCELFLLQKLNVSWSNIREIPLDLCKLKHLQSLDVSYCDKLRSMEGIVGASSLQRLVAYCCLGLMEVPADLSALQKLEVLDVADCFEMMSLGGIDHAIALQHVIASSCYKLEVVPKDLSRLEKLAMLDLGGSKSLHTLPNGYKRFSRSGSRMEAGILKVKVDGCWGLIVPLVEKLMEIGDSWVAYGNECTKFESMQSWVEAKKIVNNAAYNWLKAVLSSHCKDFTTSSCWTYLFDDESEAIDAVIRGLCEHYLRNKTLATEGLESLVHEVSYIEEIIRSVNCTWDSSAQWWIVVATAPTTFEVVTKKALLEPWEKTLLHYMIVSILPQFLEWIDFWINETFDGEYQVDLFSKTWLYKGIVAVLQECRKKLEDAHEQDIDRKRNEAWMKVLDCFLEGNEVFKKINTLNGSVLWLSHQGDFVEDELNANVDEHYYALCLNEFFFSRSLKKGFASLVKFSSKESDEDEGGNDNEGDAISLDSVELG